LAERLDVEVALLAQDNRFILGLEDDAAIMFLTLAVAARSSFVLAAVGSDFGLGNGRFGRLAGRGDSPRYGSFGRPHLVERRKLVWERHHRPYSGRRIVSRK
jgi:hypothetical protein